MSEALIALDRVACLRGSRLLFEGISLSLGPGQAVIVTGANGVGKSSLLRIAAGLLRPSAGRVVRNADVALADERGALDERQALGAALRFWARLDGAEADAGMAAMGLAHLAHVPVRMLSTGQRKRAVVARVVASRARLWVLDEPANGLDADGLDVLGAAIAAHRQAGGAVIAATHQPIGIVDAAEVRL